MVRPQAAPFLTEDVVGIGRCHGRPSLLQVCHDCLLLRLALLTASSNELTYNNMQPMGAAKNTQRARADQL